MSDSTCPQETQDAQIEPQQLLQYHDAMHVDTEQPASQPTYEQSQSQPQPTPEQLYQYHLFMSGRSPYIPPTSPTASQHSFSATPISCSTSAIVETVLALIGMLVMLVVGILGYQQMRDGLQHNTIPDMSGVIVTLASIPIVVAFFTLILRMAARKERIEWNREGQIALPDIDLERQEREREQCSDQYQAFGWASETEGQESEERRPKGRRWSMLLKRVFGGQAAAPMLAEVEDDAPPAYEERAL